MCMVDGEPQKATDAFIAEHHDAFNILQTPIFTVARDGTICDANTAALQKLGIELDDLTQHPANILNFLPDETERSAFAKAARSAVSKHHGNTHTEPPEFLVTLPHHNTRIMKIRSQLIPSGQVTTVHSTPGMLFEIEDVTEHHKALAREAFSSEISGPMSLDEILQITAEKLQTVLPYDSANVMLLDPHGKLHVHASWDSEHKQLDTKPRPTDIDSSVWKSEHTPVVIHNTKTDPRWSGQLDSQISSFIGAPIIIDGAIAGYLNINSYSPDAFSNDSLTDVTQLATSLSSAIHNAGTQQELTEQKLHDVLTGLFNRRALEELGPQRLDRRHTRATIMMIDGDHFKAVNDTYGHATGDVILQSLAHMMTSQARSVDLMARYGGEEFVRISPDTDNQRGFAMAQRLRRSSQLTVFHTADKDSAETLSQTISIGLVCAPENSNMRPSSRPQTRRDMHFYIDRADAAVYAAKTFGDRNAIGVYFEGVNTGTDKSPDYIAVYKNKDNGRSSDMTIQLLAAVDGKILPSETPHQTYTLEFHEHEVTVTNTATNTIVATVSKEKHELIRTPDLDNTFDTQWIIDAIPVTFYRKTSSA